MASSSSLLTAVQCFEGREPLEARRILPLAFLASLAVHLAIGASVLTVLKSADFAARLHAPRDARPFDVSIRSGVAVPSPQIVLKQAVARADEQRPKTAIASASPVEPTVEKQPQAAARQRPPMWAFAGPNPAMLQAAYEAQHRREVLGSLRNQDQVSCQQPGQSGCVSASGMADASGNL